jgi:hypothetical protein
LMVNILILVQSSKFIMNSKFQIPNSNMQNEMKNAT